MNSNLSEITLLSLAMLRSQINNEKDYLDYFLPFVIEVLDTLKNKGFVKDSDVVIQLEQDFGLKLPNRIIQILLKRLSKRKIIELKDGLYYLNVNELDKIDKMKPLVGSTKSELLDLVNDFIKYCLNEFEVTLTQDDAYDAFIQFFSKFSVAAIRLSISGTTFQCPKKEKNRNVFFVSKYVLYVYENNSNYFHKFETMLKGNMIANAVCSETLLEIPQSFKKTTFYLDTPFIMELYGLDGDELESAANEMFLSVRKLGGRFAVFEHTVNECESLMDHGLNYSTLASNLSTSKIKLTKSELKLKLEKFRDYLESNKIEITEAPDFNDKYSIDENKLSEMMNNFIENYKESTKKKDIKSVVNIFQLRQGKIFHRLEDCNAVFVTNNHLLAKAIHEFSRFVSDENQVSAVITDFSLANMAWLKAPNVSFNLPKAELLSMAYLSMKPSNALLKTYLDIVEELKNDPTVSEGDKLLLTSQVTESDLMDYTLGEDKALSKEDLNELLERTKNDIRKEENEKFLKEKADHENTKQEIKKKDNKLENIRNGIEKYAENRSNTICNIITAALIFILCLGIIPTPITTLIQKKSLLTLINFIGWCISVLSLIALFTGFCITKWIQEIRIKLRVKFFDKRALEIGFLDS